MKRLLLLLILPLAVAGCMDASATMTETPYGNYQRTIIPAAGLEGQTYTEVLRIEFALNQFGQVIYGVAPNGETLPVVARVQYNGTFSTPAALQLAGIILPGMIQAGGQYLLQERCINSGGCGSSSSGATVIYNTNSNSNNTSATVNGVPTF